MPHQEPYWGWCAKPGASRSSVVAVDQTNYGDGYRHRAVRGLNPVRPSWTLAFPFVGIDELNTMYAFLELNACRGFWFTPPDGDPDVDLFVVVDEWSADIAERSRSEGIIGQLAVTFTRSFNPQPLVPTL